MTTLHHAVVVTATRLEVNDIIGGALDLPRWWPSVCIDMKELARHLPQSYLQTSVGTRLHFA